MILRIVHGGLPDGTDAAALVELRERLAQVARSINGLETLLLGARRDTVAGDGPGVIEAAVVSVWRDIESMARATGADEGDGFIGRRLDLPITVERADHYEIVGRTFAALPPPFGAFLRILTVTAGPNDESRLVETLRDQQPRLVGLGLIASHLGRRMVRAGVVEAVHVTVWPDRATLDRATGGVSEMPLFDRELADWRDRCALEMFDGVEIAPRLPEPSGPPLLVIDDALRIVDTTPAGAAMLGLPSVDVVGQQVDALTASQPAFGEAAWATLLDTGSVRGEAAWAVPDIGAVVLRYVARRDTPVPGRHAVRVRRRSEPPPTLADLDAAVAEVFPVR